MGKKKSNKKNWKPLPPDAVLQTSINKKSTNWAEEVDQMEAVAANDRISSKPVVLPTAPRSSRASDFDESKVPHSGPFVIHVSNIPYEVDEDDLTNFFHGMNITSIKMPREDKKSRGYSYIEFGDRQSLIAALNKPDVVMKNRPIKIELSTSDPRGGMFRGGRGGRDGGGGMMMRSDMGGDPDRTTGNWRSGPREPGFADDRPSFDRGGGYGGGRREFSSGGGGGGGFRGGYDRDERGGGSSFGRDRDDRGGGSFRDDRAGSGFRDDRDRGNDRFDRRRDDYDRGFRDDRSNFRDRGSFNRNVDDDRREERGGGSWRDDNRPNFSHMDDRRDDRRRDDRDRDRDSRFRGPRRDDLPPVDRGSAPSGERKKLILQRRPADLPPPESIPPPAAPQASIFGGAKPVDTSAREREVEERLVRGEVVVEKGPPGPRSTGGGSTSSRERELSESEKSVTPAPVAPPPRENAWRGKPASPVVNNGRTTPEIKSPATTPHEEKSDAPKAWGPRKQEPRRTDEPKPNRPPPKTGPPSVGQDKGRPRDDKPPNKTREPKTIDDVSKMPKLVDNEARNFNTANKYLPLEDDEEEVAE